MQAIRLQIVLRFFFLFLINFMWNYRSPDKSLGPLGWQQLLTTQGNCPWHLAETIQIIFSRSHLDKGIPHLEKGLTETMNPSQQPTSHHHLCAVPCTQFSSSQERLSQHSWLSGPGLHRAHEDTGAAPQLVVVVSSGLLAISIPNRSHPSAC